MISAYVLAGDPAWVEASISSYYDVVDRIVVSYDRSGTSWSGTPLAVAESLDRIRAVDRDRKAVLAPGDYYRASHTPMENDTDQRRAALAAASESADWVLQLDTDEVLPAGGRQRLRDLLAGGLPAEVAGVDWPMRPIFRQLTRHLFLEVCSYRRRQHAEYPGSVAVRAGARLEHCRTPAGRRWFCGVRGRASGRGDGPVDTYLPPSAAVVHLSWARSEAALRQKVQAWSHSKDFDGARYIDEVWSKAHYRWPFLRDVHPIYRGVWPALVPAWLGRDITLGRRATD